MIKNSKFDFQDISGNSNAVSVSTEWIEESFPKLIILKDFDVELLQTIPTRTLPKRTIPYFDLTLLKNDIFAPNKKAKTVAESILSILLNSNVRRGGLARLKLFLPIFLSKLEYFVENNLPVHLILPSLPHKKQNPITTGHAINFIDLGDYLCMLQLKNIILSIQKVYKYGAHITILPDGMALAHLFARNDLLGVVSYFQKLQIVQKKLGLTEYIRMIDLKDLFLAEPDFDEVKNKIKNYLYKLTESNPTIAEGLEILQKAMLFNLPFDHSIEEHIQFMRIPSQKRSKSTREQLKYAAFEYASILLTMKKLELIKKAFPHAMRASVHAKATANLPLNLINDTSLIFPYNGIPVVRMEKFKRNNNIRTSTRIMRLYEIYKYPSATAVYIEGEKEPFWYEVDSLSLPG